MTQAVLSLGSNIDAETNIAQAVKRIGTRHDVLGQSVLRTTAPLGFADQPDFLNGALLIETGMSRSNLRAWLKSLEADLGRVRTTNKNGPRTIDLDIVVWNGRIVDPDVHERDFLHDAVRELCPELFME